MPRRPGRSTSCAVSGSATASSTTGSPGGRPHRGRSRPARRPSWGPIPTAARTRGPPGAMLGQRRRHDGQRPCSRHPHGGQAGARVQRGSSGSAGSAAGLLDRHLVGATGSWTTFAERFTAACAALGVYEAQRILFVSDGAAAIRWIRERSFPDAIELLDWYHLVEQLRFGVGRAHEGVLARARGRAAR